MNQLEFISKYNDEYRQKFNQDLFVRSDEDIIEELKKIIRSCQRDKFFTIKVLGFRTVEDYKEINEILYDYEESQNNKSRGKGKDKPKDKKKENVYQSIQLDDSDIKLLIVTYFIKVKDEQDTIDVIIAIPRIYEKFYFRLKGNTYSAIYQIVDASTYNNSTSTSKKSSVTLKTMFMPIRIHKTEGSTVKSLKPIGYKKPIKCNEFRTYAFSKSVQTIKYLLAKFGFYETVRFLYLNCAIYLNDHDPKFDSSMYTFKLKDSNIYVSTPKELFDRNHIIQSFVYTLEKSIKKDTTVDELYTREYWLKSLGFHFNGDTVEKGLSILDSLEFIYDISTKESIHLPEEAKKDVYHIIRWMMGEFQNLKLKDNLDISTKKVRCAEYIASLYAMKLAKSIYWISDKGKNIKLSTIKKAINTIPMYLINQIIKCQLVNYRNMVNDTDSIGALKFTYKGISGIGEGSSKSIPDIYRSVHRSHLGRVDPDSSSNTDPGITGTICPLTNLHDSHFSVFEEPNTWEDEFAKLVNNYKATVGLKEIISFKESIGIKVDKEEKENVEESIQTLKRLIHPVYKAESECVISNEIDLTTGGAISYEKR